MQTEATVWENDKDDRLSINITPKTTLGIARTNPRRFLELEIANSERDERATIVIFTESRVDFLELLRKVTDECLLRVKDDEQTGERDDA